MWASVKELVSGQGAGAGRSKEADQHNRFLGQGGGWTSAAVDRDDQTVWDRVQAVGLPITARVGAASVQAAVRQAGGDRIQRTTGTRTVGSITASAGWLIGTEIMLSA